MNKHAAPMISHRRLHPGEPWLLVTEEVVLEIEDVHCADPLCSCTRAMLHVRDTLRGLRASFWADLGSDTLLEAEAGPNATALQERLRKLLWTRDWERLRRHRAQVRTFGRRSLGL